MMLGWVGALFIGLSLGLLGSGGSILTVPVLVYLFGQDEKMAIASSLAIVGTIALAGGFGYWRKHLVDWKTIVLFGLPSMIASFIGAQMASFLSGIVQLLLFAIIMFFAAFSMLRGGAVQNQATNSKHTSTINSVLSGVGVGLMTGIIGIGGGFLIVPALVLFAGLGMRNAIGTSLFIIALNAYTGFIKYFQILSINNQQLDWQIIISVSLIGIIGTLIGNYLCHKIPQQQLKKGFSYFLFIMALFIIIKELPKIWG